MGMCLQAPSHSSPFSVAVLGFAFFILCHLGWKMDAKAALGWILHPQHSQKLVVLSLFFNSLILQSAGGKSNKFPEKKPLELAHQAKAKPSGEGLFCHSCSDMAQDRTAIYHGSAVPCHHTPIPGVQELPLF